MLGSIPIDISYGGVYIPPLFFVVLFGVISAHVVSAILNSTGLSRYFWHPPLAFAALALLMISLIGLIIFAP